MTFFPFSKKCVNALVFAHLATSVSCKSSNGSQLESIEPLSPSAESNSDSDSDWLLLPNLQNVFGSGIVEQIVDPQNPSAPAQVCLYFNRAAIPSSAGIVQPDVLQLWLEAGEFCGQWEQPNDKAHQHQFLGAKALPIKELSDTAWILYLGDRPIGKATLDIGTGLPLIQSLCSGGEYGKACRVVATPRSIHIVPGA